MSLQTVIELSLSSGAKIDISKGELIYAKEGNSFDELIKSLLGVHSKSDAIVLGEKVSSLKAKPLSQLRRQIAYIPNDLYLFEDQTVQTNIKSYLKSAGLSAPAQLTEWLKKLGLDSSNRVSDLSLLDKQLLRIVIGLAKSPEIIIVENPYTQIDKDKYQDSMDIFYKLIFEKGITYISSFSNAKITSKYPGRELKLS